MVELADTLDLGSSDFIIVRVQVSPSAIKQYFSYRLSRIRTYIRDLEGPCPNPLDDEPYYYVSSVLRPDRTRTDDLLLVRQPLYQLSYGSFLYFRVYSK